MGKLGSRLVVAVILLLSLDAGYARACLAVAPWQEIPGAETVEKASDVYLAKFDELEYVDSNRIMIKMEVLDVLKRSHVTSLSIVTDQISAVHHETWASEMDHSNDEFRNSGTGNTRLMPDCSYAPVEYYQDGSYLVLLDDGKINSSIGFERITNLGVDRWYRFVHCVLRSESADMCAPEQPED